MASFLQSCIALRLQLISFATFYSIDRILSLKSRVTLRVVEDFQAGSQLSESSKILYLAEVRP